MGRVDSGGLEQPPSAKMVSLADLHVTAGTPAAPRDAVDLGGEDPLVQALVQDSTFRAAVQASQLHTAAVTAVRLLRSQLPQREFKRPVDRRHALSREVSLDEHTPRGAPAGLAAVQVRQGAGGGAATQRLGADPRYREAMRGMKAEVLRLEDAIPWNSVRRTWRNRRTSWRRQVKATDVVPDFAARLAELKSALLTDDAAFIGCGAAWRAQLEGCLQGRGSPAALAGVWDEMRATIRSWLEGRCRAAPLSSGQLQAGAVRSVQAMQCALRHGDEAAVQAPLEAIVGGDSAGLHAVRQAIELERRVLAARLAAADSPPDADPGPPIVSYFTSISAAWDGSDFDSGADSGADCGSDATDLDSDFDL